MARLVEGLSRFFGRVEIMARGLEAERRAAELALARGRPLEARERARTILAEVPDSVLGLALWADSAEDAWLDHEAVAALSELAKWVPWRADVWLRLGRAGRRIEWPDARQALERAAAAPDEREAARQALLDLCDMDLAAGDPERAQQWLDRVIPSIATETAAPGRAVPDGADAAKIAGPDGSKGARATEGSTSFGASDPDVALRRAECALARGHLEVAEASAAGIDKESLDGRVALLGARLALARGDAARALDPALRAFLLDVTGAAEVLAAIVAASRDVVVVDRVRRVLASTPEIAQPRWQAAFAFAEGRRDDARKALSRGLAEGDAGAAAGLLRLATETRDMDALRMLRARDPALLPAELGVLVDAASLHAGGDDVRALDRLDAVGGDAVAWAAELRVEAVGRWLPGPASGPEIADWTKLLGELRRTAKALDRLEIVSAIEALAVERERPLRVAVVGEFNAGKSTFLNALLGVDVAPTGVLPTTATLHWVAWAQDPFARVLVRQAPDRVVPHAELKSTLKGLVASGAHVERVLIYAPIERLKRVEILDTPGFNAPDPAHVAAARQAFDEAHMTIWLLDATVPMKESEREVLAAIRDLDVPVQILINKADRLAPDQLPRVIEHVREGLAAAGLVSHAPPIAFSARLSLQGRLGDEAALASSGWVEVERLLSESIVDTSEALRERALRRKAARIAAELSAVASARAAEDLSAARDAVQRNEALRAGAAKLRRERPTLARTIDRALEEPRKKLAADLRPLAELTDDRRREHAVVAYVQDRIVARFADPVARLIARALDQPLSARAAAAVRASLMGASAAAEAPLALVERPIEPVLGAALEAYAAALVAEADAPAPIPPSAALAARAEAVREAFARAGCRTAQPAAPGA